MIGISLFYNTANKDMAMTVIRPVLLYGADCWTAVGKKEEHILEKTEMRMLRRIKGVTVREKSKECGHQKGELG